MRQAICYIYHFKNTPQTPPSLVRFFGDNSYLTPHQHAAKHHLQPVKEVLANDDDHGPAGGPALTGADGFDTRGGCTSEHRRVTPRVLMQDIPMYVPANQIKEDRACLKSVSGGMC